MRDAPSCSVGTDTERPELWDEHREDTTRLDLEGFGNSVKVFQPQSPADEQLIFWGCIGIIRLGGLLVRLGTGCGGETACLGNTLPSILQDFFFFFQILLFCL